MPTDNAPASPLPLDPPPVQPANDQVAIEVRDLEKAFRIPTHKVDSLKERVVRPFSSRDFRELRALDGVSFDVRKGEFFGIVGRNGSGKSTLLKLLASIYRADAGTIRMAGRLAPFIELGVGFNVELTARENVVLNGVMMGLTPQETRRKLGAVLDFADLEEFADLKLKNYSSGMLVRLAFSVMLQADADILLIDEVLAVGDAAFQQKCADAFREMKGAGKTIVLVTHEMTTVEDFCHRAMLIDGGLIQALGEPAEIGRRYLQLNFDTEGETAQHAHPEEDEEPEQEPKQDNEVSLLAAWIEGTDGRRRANLEQGERIRLRIELETQVDLPGLAIGVIVANADGVGIFQLSALVEEPGNRPLVAGRRVTVKADVENPLAPGRHTVRCGVSRINGGPVALYVDSALSFVVYGPPHARGVVLVESEVETTIEGEAKE
jgi:ABC-type polysaccharide/polyol phosphate transport system ATPase subunit